MPRNKKLILSYSDSEHEDDEELQEDNDSDSATQNDDIDTVPENEIKNDEQEEIFFEDIYGDQNLSILEFHQSLLGKSYDEISIPPPTKTKCPDDLQAQLKIYFDKTREEGYDLIEQIQRRKNMRNPSIYEKMISFCQINEMDTNYPKEIYDPEPFLQENSFYEELSRIQKEEMEKREKERKESDKNDGIRKASSSSSSSTIIPEKKSKWDSRTTAPTVVNSTAMAAALAAANKVKHLTNTASATTTSSWNQKPTVISAFGTITKKK
ncbi:SAP30-binding protein [Sarcoptes scabiei]|uniref:SAP30-binding protein n=1 Tax=Sarcoptes scabiei TaxID=52283 RepID=A0A131ZWY2_SARSC|nr:SAP30-binding protein [Sarcoptes scabiei]KPM03167.1 SAP30-binding protein-like protein [Sarcoptes scabiei]UXI17233.1 E3 ubiquitin-protein ligase Topors [Sarcoptes scabiei]